MLKKEKPMLSVAALIQAHGKLWDRTFAGKIHRIERAVIIVVGKVAQLSVH